MQNPEDSYTAPCESKVKIKQNGRVTMTQWEQDKPVIIHGSLSKTVYKLIKLSSF